MVIHVTAYAVSGFKKETYDVTVNEGTSVDGLRQLIKVPNECLVIMDGRYQEGTKVLDDGSRIVLMMPAIGG